MRYMAAVPVRVAVEERADDAAVEDVRERCVVRFRLPPAISSPCEPSGSRCASARVGRPASEARRFGRVALLERGLVHHRRSTPGIRLGAAPQVELLGGEPPVIVREMTAALPEDVVGLALVLDREAPGRSGHCGRPAGRVRTGRSRAAGPDREGQQPSNAAAERRARRPMPSMRSAPSGPRRMVIASSSKPAAWRSASAASASDGSSTTATTARSG